ncbi:MAG: HDIG domain-containing metalloprotein [Candidatus Woesearchaeota archaeon]
MIPNRQQCLELLHKQHIKERKLVHTLLVEKVALFIGKKLVENGEKVDLEKLSRAALLHDIGKHEARETGKEHSLAGYEMCQKEGIDEEICSLIKKHALETILKDPLKKWEEKIILYSDKIIKHEIIGVDKRFELWYNDKRFELWYKDHPEEKEVFYKSKPMVKALEKEIFNKARITFEDIKENVS